MKKPHEIFLEKVMSRRRFGIKPGLETISALMELLGHPERDTKFIHVAGTNGKGATCAIVESILHKVGLKTGRYTSPHLLSVNERFCIDTLPVGDGLLEDAAAETIPAIEKLESQFERETTFFECLTAIAFVLFKKAKTDVVVMETGLGGTFDATNAIPPENLLCAAITRIGLDHCDWLGNTLAAIAKEKAGIAKKGRPLVLGKIEKEAKDAIEAVAKEVNAPVFQTSDDTPVPECFALEGAFQKENARTALKIIDTVKSACGIAIPDGAIEKGFASVVWPGRFQRVSKNGCDFVIDGAHNPDAAAALKEALGNRQKPMAMIAGFCGDKDADGHLETMSGAISKAWAVAIRNERTLAAEDTAERMKKAGMDAQASPGLGEALKEAERWMRETRGTTVICGSLFLAAEALQLLDAFPWKTCRIDDNEKTKP